MTYPDSTQATGDSLFPEWQCMLPLEHLPRHCSQAAEQQVWNEIVVTWEKKGGNASKINRASERSDPTRSSEKALLASSIIMTSEPLDIKQAAVEETNLPENDPDVDLERLIVNVRSVGVSLDASQDRFDSNVSGAAAQTQTTGLPPDLRSALSDRVKEGDCEKKDD